MSVHVVSWAWKQRVGDAGLKLVLVKLADNADDHGYSWWSQRRLAEECEMGRATVQRKLAKLRELGLLEVDVQPNGGSNGYRLLAGNGNGRVPQSEAPGVRQSEAGVHHGSDAGVPHSREAHNRKEPSVTDQLQLQSARARPPEVDKRKVTKGEAQLAERVLAAFNAEFGTSFTASDYWRGVVMRIREHPELDLAEHEALIGKGHRNPWWHDDPSPAVIYGNPRAFERMLSRSDNGNGAADDDLAHYDGPLA